MANEVHSNYTGIKTEKKGDIALEQVLYKKQHLVSEFYPILKNGFRTVNQLRKNRKNNLLSAECVKRIMLAVTEVNGCEVCSYANTKSDLEMGMSDTEVKQIVTGEKADFPKEEAKAILFAHHYADTKGKPTSKAWEEIKDFYGNEKALGILGAVRMIMIGNSYGIVLSAFKSRLKGSAIETSSMWYEIQFLLSAIPFIPVALVHALVENLLNVPLLHFDNSTTDTITAAQS